MKRMLLSSAVFFSLSGAVYAGSGTSCEHYAGHASVEGKWGSERSITETSAFVPMACREDRLLYGDVRLKADNRGNREGNVGVGIRALKEKGVAGGYVYLDRRRSGATEKLFTQTTLGAEWLAEEWEVRGNAYVPLSGKKQMGTSGGEALSDPYLAGSGIYVDVAGQNAVIEKPLWGADAEVGLKMPGKDFWLHAGAFAFDASEAEGLAGGRLRATYKVTENIALTAEGQYDNVRGRQGWLGVRYTIPFGGPKTKHTGLKNRMTADPVRDVDIVTAAVEQEVTPAHTAPVENTSTQAAQRVLHVDNSAGGGGDGTLENPFNTLAAAQAILQDFDVLYINRGNGTTAGMNAGLSVAQNNVQVIGSGTAFVYDAGRFYAPVEDNFNGTVLAAAGTAPVITNAGGDGIAITGADAWVGGVTVNGATGHGIYALSAAGTDLGDITVSDVSVTNNGGTGVRIETANAGSSFDSASVMDVTATGNTNRGVYALIQSGSSVETLELDDITSQNNNGVTAGGVVVSVTGASSRLETTRISNAVISSNVTGGMIVQSANGAVLNEAEISNVTANSNGGLGMYLNAELAGLINSLDVSGTTTNSNVGQGTQVRAASNSDIGTVMLDDITSQSNTTATGRGIDITVTGAGSSMTNVTLQNSSFTGNASNGVYALADTSGLLSDIEILGTDASGNNGIGMYVLAQTSGDMVDVTLDDVTTNNNTGANIRGVQIHATGAGSTITSATLSNSTATGNTDRGACIITQSAATMGTLTIDNLISHHSVGSHGLEISVNGGTMTTARIRDSQFYNNSTGAYIRTEINSQLNSLELTNVNSHHNSGRGILVHALTGADINTIEVEDMTSQNNNVQGMEISSQGAGSSISSTSVINSSFTGNTNAGLHVNATTTSLMNSVELEGITSSGNANRGVYVIADSGADIGTLDLDDITSTGNTGANGRGLEVFANGAGSTITGVTLENSTFTGNAAIGAHISALVTGSISTVSVSDVTVSTNTGQGLLVQAQGDGDIGTVTISDTTAQNNLGANGVGVQVLATGAGSTVTSAVLDNITVSGNVNAGIYGAGSTNGMLSSIEVKNSSATGGVAQGILFDGVGNGVITSATVRNSIASGNTGAGVSARGLTGGDIGTFIARDMTVQNNTGRGIAISAEAANSVITSATVQDSALSGNSGDGGVYILSQSTGLITAATVSNVDISNNVNRGLYVVTLTGGDIGTVTIDDVTSNNNTAVNGRGIQIQASDNGSTITTANVTNSSVSGNVSNGLYGVTLSSGIISSLNISNTSSTGNGANGFAIDSQTGGQTYATLNDVTASGNAFTGIYIVSSGNSTLNTSILNSTSTGNTGNGLYIDDDTTGAYIVDVGGGTLGSTGNNRIFSNTGTEVRLDFDNGEIKAENNWWGNAAGLQAGELTTEAGTIDTTPFLAADPGP
jgi:hypothetical protein